MKLAVILPSRGLAYSETLDEIITELKTLDCEWKIYWSHSRKVPNCLNVPTNQALRVKSNTHSWFLDDDMIIPPGTLKELIKEDRHAIACDYPTSITMGGVVYDPDGRAYFTGNGCLLVKREVLESIKKPIWRSDMNWRIRYHNNHVEFIAGSSNPDKVYGGHDVHFGLRLYAVGQPIHVSPVRCGQRKLKESGDFKTNLGAHKILEWRKFHSNIMYIIKSQGKRSRENSEKTIYVKLWDGNFAYVGKEFAFKLIENGGASQIGHAMFTNYDIRNDRVKE